MLVSLDPGKKGAGVAIFEDHVLSAAFFATGSDWDRTAWSAWNYIRVNYPAEVWRQADVVIEIMHYNERQTKKVNDLIAVAHMAGAFAGYMGEHANLIKKKPYQWKGGLPKSVVTERVKKRLSHEERSRIEMPRRQSLHHNVWEAVGIGFRYLRR